MPEQDTEAPAAGTSPERAAEVADGESREDDRNERVDDSPAPDPTSGDTTAGDVPDAD